MNDAQRDQIDAIRYAVLCKLAGGFRHALMGELQAVRFSAELAARSLKTGADPERVGGYIATISEQCAALRETGDSLIEWLRPEQGTTVSVEHGVARCVKLAGDDLRLRGIEVSTDLASADVQVPKAMFQELVVVALMVLTDWREVPVDIHIASHVRGGVMELAFVARPADRELPMAWVPTDRELGAVDIELLAGVHGVDCACADNGVSLRFARPV